MQAEGLSNFLEAIAAGGVGLRHGAVALGQRDEMGQRWRGSPTLRAGDFCVGVSAALPWACCCSDFAGHRGIQYVGVLT